jgi:hypothetical protein
MAWDPTQFNAQNIQQYSEDWCTQQFGEKVCKRKHPAFLKLYTKYKPTGDSRNIECKIPTALEKLQRVLNVSEMNTAI